MEGKRTTVESGQQMTISQRGACRSMLLYSITCICVYVDVELNARKDGVTLLRRMKRFIVSSEAGLNLFTPTGTRQSYTRPMYLLGSAGVYI